MENESTQGNDQRSEEVCEFPKYIKKSKILTGFFFGDQLTEVRTGKSLNPTLTHTDENCKDPEVERTVKQIAIKADAAVDQNKYLDMMIISLLASVVGSRLFYVVFSWELYRGNFSGILDFRNGGYTFYGGLLAGFSLCPYVPIAPA